MKDLQEIEQEPLEKKVFHVKLYGGFFLKYHDTGYGMGEDWRNMRRHLAKDLEAIYRNPRSPEVLPFCNQVYSLITRDTDQFYPPEIQKIREGLLGIHRIYPEIV